MSKYNYRDRRNKIYSQCQSPCVLIIGSWLEQKLNADVEYPYKQDPNMIYFTGLEEQDLTFVAEIDEKSIKETLFMNSRDLQKEVWVGKTLDFNEACDISGINNIKSNSEISDTVMKMNKTLVLHHLGNSDMIASFDKKKKGTELLESIRCVKDEDDIEKLKSSCLLSCYGHINAMRMTKPDMNEYYIDGVLMGYLRSRGCQRLAYPNVIASGDNANVLHYMKNNAQMNGGDLLLVDSGGELNNYASDITRTWPVNGKYNNAQKEIYNLVLKAQKACINKTRPGISIMELDDISRNIITEGLLDLKILKDSKDKKKFYPHSIGHWMGIDVHDCSSVDRNKPLVEGNVFTIEPGIYIKKSDDVPEQYKGIGVRIEDDILVTKDGYENLTRFAPREISDIEALVGSYWKNK